MALSNTAVPKYYGEFRDAVIRGEIPVCREIEMEMYRIDDLIADPDVYYDDQAVEGFIKYCENELTLTDGSDLKLLDSFKVWAEQIFGWYEFEEERVYVPYDDGYGGRYVTKVKKKRLIILKDQNIMDIASRLTREKVRAPVVMGSSDTKLFYDFVANLNDSWLSFLSDLIANAKFKFDLDEMGRIGFAPVQDVASLQPVWEYTDDNSSILYPQIDMERDMYGLPNVVEVIYSTNSGYLYSKVVNDDTNSPISTINRGREIVYRVTDPDVIGNPTQEQIDEYAKQLLRNNSCLEYTVTYTHGYCPVRIGDCVLLNYRRAGIERIKAKVTSQTIKCEPGCPVSETAVFTTKLWG